MARIKKNKNDKFYTKYDVSYSLIKLLDVSLYDLVIEPSAGDGAFYDIIESTNKVGIDIEPESDNITKMDWFDFEVDSEYKKILVIGNPPFGNQGGLAMKFIKKASDIDAQTIAFILPKSFKKDSYKRKIPNHYHLIEELDIPDDSFTLEGVSYRVPCVFQIWEKSSVVRIDEEVKTTSELLQFVKKSDNPDYSVRRVGFYAGKVDTNYESKSEQSHYFIKSSDGVRKVIESIVWEHNNTSGPRSIGKFELIKRIESLVN